MTFKKGENPNHAPKGSSILVDPIRDPKAIEKIKHLLRDQPRNLFFFTLSINNGLRASDLLKLKVKDLKYLQVGEFCRIKESKTGKWNIVFVNQAVYDALHNYLTKKPLKDEDYLIHGKKRGPKRPLKIQMCIHLIKRWCREVGLKGNFGTHSLRKSFGYHQRTQFNVSYEILSRRYNHSDPGITMRYLGVQREEVLSCLTNEI